MLNLTVGLRYGRDDDIIEHLSTKESRADYVRELIRKDMK